MIPIPSGNGLLIESRISADNEVSDGLLVLFSLLHPLGDVCPVVIRCSSAATSCESYM